MRNHACLPFGFDSPGLVSWVETFFRSEQPAMGATFSAISAEAAIAIRDAHDGSVPIYFPDSDALLLLSSALHHQVSRSMVFFCANGLSNRTSFFFFFFFFFFFCVRAFDR